MTALQNIQREELTKTLKDPEILIIENENLSHLNLGNMDLSGKTFKDCDITDTNFGDCAGLPTLQSCKVSGEKTTDVLVIKSKTGNMTIFSMIRGNMPYYMVNGTEYNPTSKESTMVAQVRILASKIK